LKIFIAGLLEKAGEIDEEPWNRKIPWLFFYSLRLGLDKTVGELVWWASV
jgi:hypothetical protein